MDGNGGTAPADGFCNAHLRGTEPPRYCRKFPIKGRTRCRLHGGTSLVGLEAARTSLAKYRGADMPTQLAARFLAAMDDPQLLSLSQDIGLVSARLAELVERFPTKESAEAWAIVNGLAFRLEGVIPNIVAALERPTPPRGEPVDADVPLLDDPDEPKPYAATVGELRDVATSLRGAVDLADAERAIWRELFEAQEQLRRLNDTERRREESLQTIVTARQGQALFGALLATIIEEVQDVDTKRRVLDRLRSLLAHAGPAALGAGGTVAVNGGEG